MRMNQIIQDVSVDREVNAGLLGFLFFLGVPFL